MDSKRQLALERELAQLTRINSTVANLIQTIKITRFNVERMDEASTNTHTLLDQWIRILSQTNFTNEIMDNSKWNGVESSAQDEDADNEYDQKVAYERALLQQLSALDSENAQLQSKIDQKQHDRELAEAKSQESTNRRRRDLGLFNRKPVKRVRS